MSNTIKLSKKGFTIVEILVTIVVILILTSLSIVSYSGMQRRAQIAKINSDLSQMVKAIKLARLNTGMTLVEIDETTYTAGFCTVHPDGTDLAALPRTDGCWVQYLKSLDNISSASGIDIRDMVDPWGRPYRIDENEGDFGSCHEDTLKAYSNPFVADTWFGDVYITVPMSGYSYCEAS